MHKYIHTKLIKGLSFKRWLGIQKWPRELLHCLSCLNDFTIRILTFIVCIYKWFSKSNMNVLFVWSIIQKEWLTSESSNLEFLLSVQGWARENIPELEWEKVMGNLSVMLAKHHNQKCVFGMGRNIQSHLPQRSSMCCKHF